MSPRLFDTLSTVQAISQSYFSVCPQLSPYFFFEDFGFENSFSSSSKSWTSDSFLFSNTFDSFSGRIYDFAEIISSGSTIFRLSSLFGLYETFSSWIPAFFLARARFSLISLRASYSHLSGLSGFYWSNCFLVIDQV